MIENGQEEEEEDKDGQRIDDAGTGAPPQGISKVFLDIHLTLC